MVTSFDIFDTLITRTVASPGDVFKLLALEDKAAKITQVPVDSFVQLRISAERVANDKAPGNQAKLTEIYAEIGQKLNLSEEDLDRLVEYELQVEKAVSRRVGNADRLVNTYRRKSQYLVFTSEMYLPTYFLKDLLVIHGIWREGDLLFVSSEQRASKKTGELFTILAHSLGVKASEILHIGNDAYADAVVPASLGIAVQPLTIANLSSWEVLYSKNDSIEASKIAGFARVTRVNASDGRKNCSPAWYDMSCSVVAPLIVSFVRWIAARAQALGIKQLFFLARDGQLPFKVFKQLKLDTMTGISATYLYASRAALRLPAINKVGPYECSWILERHGSLTLGNIAKRLRIQTSDLKACLGSQFVSLDGSESIVAQDVEYIKSEMDNESSHLNRLILKSAREARRNTLSYLEQNQFGRETWAVVDLGWGGTLQHSLETITGGNGVGFYLGLKEVASETLRNTHAEAFLWDGRKHTFYFEGAINFIETLFRADHPGTTSYKISELGCWIPEFNNSSDDGVTDKTIRATHNAVIDFTDVIMKEMRIDKILQPSHSIACLMAQTLLTTWRAPTHELAREAIVLRHSESMDGIHPTELVIPLGFYRLIHALWNGFITPSSNQEWAHFSLAASPQPYREAFANILKVRMKTKFAMAYLKSLLSTKLFIKSK